MKKMIRCLAICTGVLLLGPMVSSANEESEHLVGVATIFDDAGWQTQVEYFNELIGPALHMKFMYSDKLNNSMELTDFMTQAIAMGCDGIINFVTQNDCVAAGANLAEEKGVWYVTQNSMMNEEVAELEHNLGHVGASVLGMESAYDELLTELITQEGKRGFFIYTGSAAGGNQGAGAASHFYSTKGMLEAIAKAYDLAYEKPMEDLINEKTSGYVETGTEDVVIYLSSSSSVLQGIEDAEEVLKEGSIDTLIAVTSYTSFTEIVSHAEEITGEDISIVATVSDDVMARAGFETKDKAGHSILQAAVVNPLSIANAKCSWILSQGIEGNGESVKEDGHTCLYEIEPQICTDAEEYTRVEASVQEQIQEMLQNQ